MRSGSGIGAAIMLGRAVMRASQALSLVPASIEAPSDVADIAFHTIDPAFEPPPAFAGLDDPGLGLGCADVMGLRPPTPDSGGEHFEGSGGRCVDHDALAHRRRLNCFVHGFSLVESRFFCSLLATSRAYASRATSQKPSSQARIAARPCGSMR